VGEWRETRGQCDTDQLVIIARVTWETLDVLALITQDRYRSGVGAYAGHIGLLSQSSPWAKYTVEVGRGEGVETR
jgi:hypothetical protein